MLGGISDRENRERQQPVLFILYKQRWDENCKSSVLSGAGKRWVYDPGLYRDSEWPGSKRGKPGSFAFDPTKITISCRDLGITGFQLDMILSEKYAIQMELSDFYNVLAVGSFGDTKEGMDRLLTALKEISKEYFGINDPIPDFLDIPPIPSKTVNPRGAFYADKKSVLLTESLGRISGEFLLAYPPGIPLLCPGEIITSHIIDYVNDLKKANLYVQGTEDPTVEKIKILNIWKYR